MVLLGVKFSGSIPYPAVYSIVKKFDLVLTILSLVDLALIWRPSVVMVMFSGYENFVSRLNIEDGREKLSWLGKGRLGHAEGTKSPPQSCRFLRFTC